MAQLSQECKSGCCHFFFCLERKKKMVLVNEINFKSKQIAEEFVNTVALELSGQASHIKKICEETLLMLKYVDELKRKENEMMRFFMFHVKNIVPNMTLENGGCAAVLGAISHQLFQDKLNWGRVVSLHLFFSLVLRELKLEGRLTVACEKEMSRCLGDCLAQISAWIANQRGGWNDFLTNFESTQHKVFLFFMSIVLSVLLA